MLLNVKRGKTFFEPSLNEIDKINFKEIADIEDEKIEFSGICGNEHYRLLAYFSTLFNNTIIIDIGSHRGKSSLALSYNKSNTVISFDIIDNVYNEKIKKRENIQFYLENLWDNEIRNKWRETILNSGLIFLDVDPHNGKMEYEFYQFLKSINYTGILLCDDIWYFKEMRDNFWYNIPDNYKYDLTQYGHWSGTGAITFSPSVKPFKNNNWTLVTAYFDLTKTPDATEDIKIRNTDYYLNTYSNSTLQLPYNLVIYCDKESYEQINKIRPDYLKERTHYIICDFEEFQMVINGKTFKEYREQIKENRINNPYNFDNRNTPSYLLFCMSRYIILKRTIINNPFNSTHFAWINICIERMGYKNLIYLDDALSCNRDKFSTCFINYRKESFVRDYQVYFQQGLCSFCSGFFTGNSEYMYKFCDAILQKGVEMIDLGYGHSDETFYPLVYFDKPELFDVYYGDYSQMITNYHYLRENSGNTIHLMVAISYEYCDYAVCIKCCEFIIESYIKNKCVLSENDLYKLGFFLINSKKKIVSHN